MKKFALALMAASAGIFGLGMVASAAGYDPSLDVNPDPVVAGEAYSVTYNNCIVGDTITFTQADSTPTEVTDLCEAVGAPEVSASLLGILLPQAADPLGVAVGNFTAAPTEPGTYNGTAVGVCSEVCNASPLLPFSFTLTGETTPTNPTTPTTAAPGGEIPKTGNNGVGTTTGIAIGLLVVGLGLFVVSQVRRRQDPTAV